MRTNRPNDTNILMTVEKLITSAMGPPDKNIVDFKKLQAVLMILAKQTRILEKEISISCEDFQNWQEMIGITDSDKSIDSNKESRQSKATKGSAEHKESRRRSRAKSTDSYPRSKFDDENIRSETKAKTGEHYKDKRKYSVGKKRLSLSVEPTPKDRSKEREDNVKRERDDKRDKYSDKKKSENYDDKKDGAFDEKKKTSSDGKRTVHSEDKSDRDKLTDKKKSRYSEDKSERDKYSDKRKSGYSEEEKGGAFFDEKKEKASSDGKRTGYSEGKSEKSDWDSVKSSRRHSDVSETGVTRTYSGRRLSSIEVVTLSEFKLLQNDVERLKQSTGPLPLPTMPTNKELVTDIKTGKASLSDTMEAMNVNSRLEASEEMVMRMADILNSLAASGALPSNVMGMVSEANAEAKVIATKAASPKMAKPVKPTTKDSVTKEELNDAVNSLKSNIMKQMTKPLDQTLSGAEIVQKAATQLQEKLGAVVRMDETMNNLERSVIDSADYLDEIEKGIFGEVKNCGVDISNLNSDLQKALTSFRTSTLNPETLAVNALTEKYNELVIELEAMNYMHTTELQRNTDLNLSLNNIKSAISILQDEKAERDEAIDMFKDKADKSVMDTMFSQKDFEKAKENIESKLNKCLHIFEKQDNYWQDVIKDLKDELNKKAYFMQLIAHKEEITEALKELENKLNCVDKRVGEPTAAILSRKVSKDAFCAACLGPARMEVLEKTYGMPHQLPCLERPELVSAEEDDCKKIKRSYPLDHRSHYCNRWTGGSHTMLNTMTREQVNDREEPADNFDHYNARGTDGHIYKLSVKCAPCAECNETGAGDANLAPSGAADKDKTNCTSKK